MTRRRKKGLSSLGPRRFLVLLILYIVVNFWLFLTHSIQNTNHEASPSKSKATTKTFFNTPFYVYDNELNWMNATLSGVPISDSWYPTFKHSDDYWFLKSALEHPKRVDEPYQAKLFFVPLLLNAAAEARNNASTHFCVHGKCQGDNGGKFDWVRRANRILANSTWFQRHRGRDHIVVASHYDHPAAVEESSFSNLRQCAMVSFENFQKLCFKGLNRCTDHLAGLSDIGHASRCCNHLAIE